MAAESACASASPSPGFCRARTAPIWMAAAILLSATHRLTWPVWTTDRETVQRLSSRETATPSAWACQRGWTSNDARILHVGVPADQESLFDLDQRRRHD
jgi:hypothetical protein